MGQYETKPLEEKLNETEMTHMEDHIVIYHNFMDWVNSDKKLYEDHKLKYNLVMMELGLKSKTNTIKLKQIPLKPPPLESLIIVEKIIKKNKSKRIRNKRKRC